MPAPASTRSSQMSAPPILRAKNTSHNTNNTTTMVQIRLTTNEDLQSRALPWRRCYPEYHDLRYHPYHYGLEACPVRLEKERAHRRELAHRLRRNESDPVEAAELSKVDQHPGELGSETFERERDLTALAIIEGELSDIELALRRLDEGGYGDC